MRERFSVVMARMVNGLRGTPCIGLEDVTPDCKSIMASGSFDRLVTMPDEVAEAVATDIACSREDAPASPRHGQPDRVRRNRPGNPQPCPNQGVQLPVAVADTGKLTSAAGANVRYGQVAIYCGSPD